MIHIHRLDREVLLPGLSFAFRWPVVLSAWGALAAIESQTPEHVAMILGAIGIGLGLIIERAGKAWVNVSAARDLAYKQSTLAKLEEAARDREALKLQNEELLRRIDALVTDRDTERKLRDHFQEDMVRIATEILQRQGYLKPGEDGPG